MAKRLGKRTIAFQQPPAIIASAAIVGEKEGQGPLGQFFDVVSQDSHFGQKSWELAESEMQKQTIALAVEKAGLQMTDLDCILAGDLLNQCIGSSLASVEAHLPYLGLYGACSTMAQGLALGAALIDGGAIRKAAAAASSHFCSAERQYRFPLAYGGQRPPTAQWTATAAGAAILAKGGSKIRITHAIFGEMVDMGVKDANNMGSAMAPSACDTLEHLFEDTHTQPTDYDRILTGDLAAVGADLLVTLLRKDGIDITPVYSDCGSLLYGSEQDTHAGGSGCGCSAAVVCGHILRDMEQGTLHKVIFAGTGALMSPTSLQQGQSIAGICHAVVIERAN